MAVANSASVYFPSRGATRVSYWQKFTRCAIQQALRPCIAAWPRLFPPAVLRRAWVLHMGQHHLGDLYSSVQAELEDEDSEYQLYQVRPGVRACRHAGV